MGHQQAHEAHQPGKAHRRAAQHRRQGKQEVPGRPGRQPQGLGHLIPQGEQVQLIAHGKGPRPGQEGEQGRHLQGGHCHPRQPAHHKAACPQGGLREQDGDRVDGGGEHAADGHPGQHQGDAAGPGPPGQGVHQHTRPQRPQESCHRDRRHRGRNQGGAEDCPQACAGIHPDDIGPRQGVAQHSLDDDPAHRQGTAAQQGRQGAGQAGIDHDIVCLGLTAHQGGQDL